MDRRHSPTMTDKCGADEMGHASTPLILFQLLKSLTYLPRVASRSRGGVGRHRPIIYHLTLLHPILEQGGLARLPLHVRRIVQSAALQWRDVIDDIARAGAAAEAGRGTGMVPLESGLGRRAAFEPSAGVASAGDAGRGSQGG